MIKILKKLEKTAFKMESEMVKRPKSFHVAFIFDKGKIYSTAHNNNTTHPLTKKYRYYSNAKTHAELKSVISLKNKNPKKYSIAVLRINRQKKLANSKPCCGCMNLLQSLKFKSIYFTDNDGIWNKI